MFIYSRWLMVAGLGAALAAPLGAQTLTLQDALRRADTAGYANRVAAGAARERRAAPTGALAGLLPALHVEAAWMRTTDPVAVFGTGLRQRTVTAADFAPATLNDPAARSDVGAAVVLEIPLLNADAWLRRSTARNAAGAASESAAWTAAATRTDVVRAYFGALLARERVVTLETARRAARDHVRQAAALADQGVVTRSDALLAEVKAGEVESDLLGAVADAGLARSALALLLGTPRDTGFALPAALPAAASLRALAADSGAGLEARADVRAAEFGLAAAHADLRRARTLYLPRINAFGRSDWHAASSFAAGKPMWTIGVAAQWSLVSWSRTADRRAAAGRLDAAAAGAEAAAAQAALDVARRDADAAVALSRLAIAEQAVAQASEAHRIVTRKYEGGLATVVELLDASATETATRLRHAVARYDLIVAIAARRQAHGLDVRALATLDLP